MTPDSTRASRNAAEYVVRAARPADAVGQALRDAFTAASLPADMQAALDALGAVRRA